MSVSSYAGTRERETMETLTINNEERRVLCYVLSQVRDCMREQDTPWPGGGKCYRDEYAVDIDLKGTDYQILKRLSKDLDV